MDEPLIRNGDLIAIKMKDGTVHRCIVMDGGHEPNTIAAWEPYKMRKLSCLRDWTNDEKGTNEPHPNH